MQAPARDLISPTWVVDAFVTVRDRLLSLDNDALVAARDSLACTLSSAIGGLTARDTSKGRTLVDDGPDFEDRADPAEWPCWTPDDVLALSLPSISGGAPFEPSPADWDDYFAHRGADDDGRYTEADARAAGLAV